MKLSDFEDWKGFWGQGKILGTGKDFGDWK